MWDPLLLGIPHYVHHYMIATVGNYQQTPFVPGVLGATLRNGMEWQCGFHQGKLGSDCWSSFSGDLGRSPPKPP